MNAGLPTIDTPGFEGLRIMAVGDLNNDNKLDLVAANADATELTAFYFNSDTYSYDITATIEMPANHKAESVVISKEAKPLQNLLVVVNNTPTSETTLQWYE